MPVSGYSSYKTDANEKAPTAPLSMYYEPGYKRLELPSCSSEQQQRLKKNIGAQYIQQSGMRTTRSYENLMAYSNANSNLRGVLNLDLGMLLSF